MELNEGLDRLQSIENQILAKLIPYIEDERKRERAVQEYREKVRTILVNYSDTVAMRDGEKIYYINGRSVDEYLEEADKVEVKQEPNQ